MGHLLYRSLTVPLDEAVTCRPPLRPATAWALQSHLELAALATAVPCARLHARAVTLEWGLPAVSENVEQIVSELVTNAISATECSRASLTTPVIRLWLASDRQSALICVWDGSSQMPARKEAGADEESGRGLLIVEQLSREWGSCRQASGKVVWVLI